MTDNRRFSRVPFDAPVYFDFEGNHFEGEIIDISLKGVLIQLPQPHVLTAVGQQVNLHIGESDSPIPIRMIANCVHIDGNLMGFDCQKIDLDSATFLRRLLEVNLGSDSQVNDELAALVAAHSGR